MGAATTFTAEEATAPDRDIISVIKGEFAAKELADQGRHRLMFESLQALWGSHRALEGRVTKVERNTFPTAALWALVAIGAGELLLDGVRLFR